MWQRISKQPLIIPKGSFIKVNAIVNGNVNVREVIEVELKEDLMVEPVVNTMFECRTLRAYYIKWWSAATVVGLTLILLQLFK